MGRSATACGLVFLLTGPAPAGGPAGDWCHTMDDWQERGGHVPVGGTCPVEGACDVAQVRDGFIPDATTAIRTVRVHLVVLRNDNGNDPAATEQDIVDQMIRMNNDFAPWRFAFQHTWEYVDSSIFRYGGDNNLMKLLYARDPAIQCNIFVKSYPGGFGRFPWNPVALTALGGIVLGETLFGGDSSAISHEMGHNLGLWHTHHGVSEVTPCGVCYEHPGGHDGDVAGDFCADTPATPVSHACSDPDGMDLCSGLPWGETLPEDYMSYGQSGCWTLFTEQQAGRMHCWFDSVLTGWLVTCTGDGNGDGTVGLADFQGLAEAWGTGAAEYDFVPEGGDGVVDIQDFLGLLLLWGPCPSWTPEPPANDDCAGAEPITQAITDFNTSGATTDGPLLPSACDEGSGLQFQKDIWYLYAPQCTGTAFVNTCNAVSFDARLAAYTGACGALTLVACSDDRACGEPSMQFPVSCGQAYLIRVGGAAAGESGSGTLFASCFGSCGP